MKINTVHKSLLILSCLAICCSVAQADITYIPKFQDPQGSSGLQTQLGLVIDWVWYIFYLLGGIMLGAAAFKLKAGDIGGFAKNVAGSVALFFAPAIVKLIVKLASSAGN